jgi:hypothetical protein
MEVELRVVVSLLVASPLSPWYRCDGRKGWRDD